MILSDVKRRLLGSQRAFWAVGAILLAMLAFWISPLSDSPFLFGRGSVNRTAPVVSPPPARLHFSDNPSDDEFLRVGLFAQPLVPAGHGTASENQDLAGALLAYEKSVSTGDVDAVAPLTKFLARHPASAWRPILLLNLGTTYRQTGHFSAAMAAFQDAWNASKALGGHDGQAIGDAAIGELTQFNAYLGRKDTLAALLDEVKDRPIRGSAAELISSSSRGLAHMTEWPEQSFRCGPLALLRILYYLNPHPASVAVHRLEQAESTSRGLSLTDVHAIAESAGMHYQMAYRSPGARMVTPAVAHWKMGHYAAIVGKLRDRYLVKDSTFGEDIHITARTLDEEGSGYFLIPKGALPFGWRHVDASEGKTVWGRGDTGSNRDQGSTGPAGGGSAFPEPGSSQNSTNPNKGCGGCTTWNVEPMTVGLQLHDRPVGYQPPIGPSVYFDIYYSQRDVQQPATFNYINFGSKWTFTWLSYITDNRTTSNSVNLYQRGGGDEPYAMSGATSSAGLYSQAYITAATASGATTFIRHLKDGSTETFAQPLGRKYFMTAVTDRQGNKVTIAYDSQMRIASLTDAAGQVTTLAYTATDPLKVTKITDPFGRAATFTYNAVGQLASITDVLGIVSQYTYGSGDFVSVLKTPYGTTNFAYGDSTTDSGLGDRRFLNITDALGRVSRVEFRQFAPGIEFSDPDGLPKGMAFGSTGDKPNTFMWNRNSFIWNPVQYAAATASGGLDYTKAKLIHWLHIQTGSTLSASRVVESMKEPLEKRVWYIYPNQFDPIYVGTSNTPIQVGRILDGGSSQVQTYTYNTIGNVTSSTDAVGRTQTYTYDATGTDILTIRNTTGGTSQLLTTITYNSQHRPLTVTAANGGITRYEYNAAGQPTKRTDALGNVATYSYDARGYLTTFQDALAAATYSFAYDNIGHIASATDPAGSKVAYTYDAADRPISATFPDGTTTKFTYNLLDLASVTDRLGQTTQLSYDAERELVIITDPLGQTNKYTYTSSGQLASITDGNGHTTITKRDIQDRIVAKTFADGTAESLAYEASSSRVASATDALKQVSAYAYNRDDSVAAVTYTNAPKVSFTYDGAFPRVTSMTDGIGTTSYAYYAITATAGLGATQLQSATSPVAGGSSATDVVSYSYDALGRVSGRTVNGSAETTTFDAIGRVTAATNALDTFTYGYADGTARISQVSSLKGPGLALTYYDGTGDELLKQMRYTAGSVALAQFGYEFNANDNVTKFTQAYVGQKLAALGTLPRGIDGRSPGSAIMQASMLPIGGQTEAFLASSSTAATMTKVMLLLSALGWLSLFANRRWRPACMIPPLVALTVLPGCGGDGSTSSGSAVKPAATASVIAYGYDHADRLTSAAIGTDVSSPVTAMPANSYAYDTASNLTSIIESASAKALTYTLTNAIVGGTYDANGSPTALDGATYTWDGANRLLSVTSSGNETDLFYDGLSRLVRIVEKTAGAVTADHAYGWCGNARCVERDNRQAGSPISKRFFDQGEVQGTTALYYVTDRLGSLRQLVDASGAVQAQYDYNPYGRRTKVSGAKDSDIGFTGLFHNAASGLDFAVYRAYNSSNGRWLNRDPIREAGGVNLYEYVDGNPQNDFDLLGLKVNINMFPPNSIAHGNADTGPATENFSVGGHGNPSTVNDENGNPITPKDLARRISKDPNYRKGDDVDLYSCHTGKVPDTGGEPYAKTLAKELGAGVNAPTSFEFYYPNGDVMPFERRTDQTEIVPDTTRPGNIVHFTP